MLIYTSIEVYKSKSLQIEVVLLAFLFDENEIVLKQQRL